MKPVLYHLLAKATSCSFMQGANLYVQKTAVMDCNFLESALEILPYDTANNTYAVPQLNCMSGETCIHVKFQAVLIMPRSFSSSERLRNSLPVETSFADC